VSCPVTQIKITATRCGCPPNHILLANSNLTCVNPNCTGNTTFDPNRGCVCPLGETFLNQTRGTCTKCGPFNIWNGKNCQSCPTNQVKLNGTHCLACNSTSFYSCSTRKCEPCPKETVKTSPTSCSRCEPGATYNSPTRQCDCPINQIKESPIRCSACNENEIYSFPYKRCTNCKSNRVKVNITTCLPCDDKTAYFQKGTGCICKIDGSVLLNKIFCGIFKIWVTGNPCKESDLGNYCFWRDDCYNSLITEILPQRIIVIESMATTKYIFNLWILLIPSVIILMFY